MVYQNCGDISLKHKQGTPSPVYLQTTEVYPTKIVDSPGVALYTQGYTGGAHGLSHFRACYQPCTLSMIQEGLCSLATIADESLPREVLLNPEKNPGCERIQYVKPGESKTFPVTPQWGLCRDVPGFINNGNGNEYVSDASRNCPHIYAGTMDERDYRFGPERNEVFNTGAIVFHLSVSQVPGKYAPLSELIPDTDTYGHTHTLVSEDRCNAVFNGAYSEPSFGIETTDSALDKLQNKIKRCLLKPNADGKVFLNIKLVSLKDLPPSLAAIKNLGQSRCYDSAKGCSFIFEMR